MDLNFEVFHNSERENRFMRKRLIGAAAAAVMCIYISAAAETADVYSTSFENENGGFSGDVVSVGTEGAYDGSYALKVFDRTELDLSPFIIRGRSYNIEIYAKGGGNVRMGIRRRTSAVGTGEEICSVSSISADSSSWTRLSIDYENNFEGLELEEIGLFIETDSPVYIDGFKITDIYETDDNGMAYETDVPSLSETYKDYFKIGNFGSVYAFSNAEESQWLTHHFDVLGLENGFKLGFLRTSPTSGYNFSQTDAYVEGALASGKELHGHVLVWHSRSCSPDWLFTKNSALPLSESNMINRAEALERMKEHIYTVVGRYKGKIKSWDVVNEAVSDSADENGVCQIRSEYEETLNGEKVMRPCYWQNIIGNDFIDKAFEYAHEADPEAELYYNDYSERNGRKWRSVYNLIKRLREKGIDANIGLQCHISLDTNITGDPQVWPTWEEWSLEYTIEQFEKLGCKIRLSEVDVNGVLGNPPSIEDEIKLAEKYEELFEMIKRHSDSIECVSFWGATDNSYMGADQNPGLFDEQGRAKRSFWSVIGAAAGDISAESTLTADSSKAEFEYTINNISDNSEDVTAFLAQYSYDGRLLKLTEQAEHIPAFDGKAARTGRIEAERSEGAVYFKGMLWDSGMNPITEAASKEISSQLSPYMTAHVRDGNYADTVQSSEIFIKNAGEGYLRSGFIEFDLRNINEVNDAELKMDMESSGNTFVDISAVILDDPVDLTKLTYNNAPETPIKIPGAYDVVQGQQEYSADITEIIKEAKGRWLLIRLDASVPEVYISAGGKGMENEPQLIIR